VCKSFTTAIFFTAICWPAVRLCCSQLHEHYYEVPAPIREYIQEVKAQLAMLTGDGGSQCHICGTCLVFETELLLLRSPSALPLTVSAP